MYPMYAKPLNFPVYAMHDNINCKPQESDHKLVVTFLWLTMDSGHIDIHNE